MKDWAPALAPFEKFDGAFKQVAGFEADIGVRLVTLPQCPAINFLRQVRGNNGSAPILGVSTFGQNLTGTIKNRANAQIELLLVNPTGTVQNLTSTLKGDDPKSFEMGFTSPGNPNSDPLLLIAIATSKPLEALRPGGTIAAKDFFGRLVQRSDPGRRDAGRNLAICQPGQDPAGAAPLASGTGLWRRAAAMPKP